MKNIIGLIFLIILIACKTSFSQSWSVTGDTVSSTGTVKAADLNIYGTCVKFTGILTDTNTDLLGINKLGKVAPLTGRNLAISMYPLILPILPCDTTAPQWYRQQTFDGAEALVTRPCTWVGIGEGGITNFPNAPLSVSNNSSTVQFSVIKPDSTRNVFTIDGSGNTYMDGNVGIGTTSSSAQLNIYSASSLNRAFTIANSSGNVFSIDHLGKVLIQTTSATYPLNVGGTIWANEVKVCLSGCDFVFDKGYKLMPLSDLEQYLQLNHHLPGISSAKEMETSDGVALGKMNSQLLQKVEELTLYTIQLKKQLDEMQVEIAKLKEGK